jgi:hypothetical protein
VPFPVSNSHVERERERERVSKTCRNKGANTREKNKNPLHFCTLE